MAFNLLSSAEALLFSFFLVRVFQFSFLSKSAACSFFMISDNATYISVSSSHAMPETCYSFLSFLGIWQAKE